MAGSRSGVVAVLALLLAWGCAAGAGAPEAGTGVGAGGGPLLASVQATPAGDSVHFLLQVTNTGEGPAELAFGSGQSFDFEVRDGSRSVWRWSADQMFTQALRSERLSAGATLEYAAVWTPPPGASGEYTVTGTLTTRDRSVQQAARFRIP